MTALIVGFALTILYTAGIASLWGGPFIWLGNKLWDAQAEGSGGSLVIVGCILALTWMMISVKYLSHHPLIWLN